LILKRPEKQNIADLAGYFGEAQRNRTKHIRFHSMFCRDEESRVFQERRKQPQNTYDGSFVFKANSG
jgi:hypothetical protein